MPAVETSPALFLAVVGTLTSLGTLAMWVLRGRGWAERLMVSVMRGEYGRRAIEKVSMDVLQSTHGQEAVRRMHQERLDLQMDTLSARIMDLSNRIDTMSSKLERRLDKLDADLQSINVRVTVLEQRGSLPREYAREID